MVLWVRGRLGTHLENFFCGSQFVYLFIYLSKCLQTQTRKEKNYYTIIKQYSNHATHQVHTDALLIFFGRTFRPLNFFAILFAGKIPIDIAKKTLAQKPIFILPGKFKTFDDVVPKSIFTAAAHYCCRSRANRNSK